MSKNELDMGKRPYTDREEKVEAAYNDPSLCPVVIFPFYV